MKQDIEAQAQQEEERRQRRNARFSLGLAVAGAGIALLVLGLAVPQLGWPAFLIDLFEFVGVTLMLGGAELAGWAVWMM